MHTPSVECPRAEEVDLVRRVRDVLRACDYADGAIAELLQFDGPLTLGPKRIPPLMHRTSGGSPLETLVRLFILGVPVGIGDVRRAVAPMTAEEWVSLGLLAVDGDSAFGAVQLRCYQDLVVAFDFTDRPWANLRQDFVMGISVTTLTLTGLTVRRPSRATLDLGTGSGFQAFMAAGHSDRVVAADRSPRAVQMTQFNIALNDLGNVSAAEGDFFQPVEDQRFDLIVSNPPFIISPESSHFFLHSGLEGDEVCRRIVTEAPAHLEEGGFCQLLANWIIPVDGDWRHRLESWFGGTGCDGLILDRGVRQLDEYAASWIEADDDDELSSSFARWMSYYERSGVAAIGTGLITLRRRSGGRNWFRISESPEKMTFPCGDEVLRTFEAHDFLEMVDDATLLDSRLQLAADVRLVQEGQQRQDQWETIAAHLIRTEGFQYSGAIDGKGARIVQHCDGTRTVGELMSELAVLVGASAEAVIPEGLQLFRQLIERGYLLLVGGAVPAGGG